MARLSLLLFALACILFSQPLLAQPQRDKAPPRGTLTSADLQASGGCSMGSSRDYSQTCIVPGMATLVLSSLDLRVQLELVGGGPDASLRFPPPKNSAVKVSQKLILGSLYFDKVKLVSGDLKSSNAMGLVGIQFSGANAQLVVMDSLMALNDCSDWTALASSICSLPGDTPVLLGNSSVNPNGTISISFFQSQNSKVIWSNVTIQSCPSSPGPPSYPTTCIFTSTLPTHVIDKSLNGPLQPSFLTDLISNIPANQSSEDLIVGPVTFAGNGSTGHPVSIGLDLKLMGDRKASTDINFDRLSQQITLDTPAATSSGIGSLTLYSLVLWNLPTSPSSFPNGLLSVLPWYMALTELSDPSGSPYLILDNCTLVISDEEFAFLNALFSNPCKTCSAWLSDPFVGSFDTFPSVDTSLRGSFSFVNASGGGGRWTYSNVVVVPWSSTTALRFNRGKPSSPPLGLSAGSVDFTLPSDDPTSLPLSFLTPINTLSVNLTLLGSTLRVSQPEIDPTPQNRSLNGQNSFLNQLHKQWVEFSQSHFIFALDEPPGGSFQLITFTGIGKDSRAVLDPLKDSTIIIGNPANPSVLALDFDSMQVQSNPSLTVPVVLPITPSAVIKFSSITLYNLPRYISQSRSQSNEPDPNISSVLGNYTLLFWNFGLQRGYDASITIRGQLLLANCVVVVNPIELQVLRSIIKSDTYLDLPINPAAQMLITSKLTISTATLQGSDVDLDLLVDPRANTRGLSPGDIFFSTFEWFGSRGINVTITCNGPLGAVVNFQRRESIIGQGIIFPKPKAPPSAPDKPPRLPRPLIPSRLSPPLPDASRMPLSLQLTGWQLGLIIFASILFAALLFFIIIVLLRRWRKADYVAAGSGGVGDIEMKIHDDFKAGPGGLGQSSSSAQSPSSPSAQPGPHLHVAGPSGSYNVRNDTEVLIDAIFEGTSIQSVASDLGGGLPLSHGPKESSMGASLDPLAPSRGQIYPWQDPRKEMQRQMDELKEELRGGDSPWEVKEMIGKGGFGVVYKGTWRGLEVAIKRVIFQMTTSDAMAERSRRLAMREAAINSTLNHSNVVHTYHYDMQPLGSDPKSAARGITDWQLYLIQEYCEGGSLFNAIQDKLFHEPKSAAPEGPGSSHGSSEHLQPRLSSILSVAIDIASGCSYIHSKNIIHGDLKPDNVLLKATRQASSYPPQEHTRSGSQGPGSQFDTMTSPRGLMQVSQSGSTTPSVSKSEVGVQEPIAKICDFGMSINIRGKDSHVSGVRHGTPLYIAPEILSNGKAQKAADVYSFGVILWELYHGCLAWSQLMNLSKEGGVPASLPKKGKGRSKLSTYHPSLFVYTDCLLPRYEEISRQCLRENPILRPTFEEVKRELEAIKGEWEAGLGGSTTAPGGFQPTQLWPTTISLTEHVVEEEGESLEAGHGDEAAAEAEGIKVEAAADS